MANIVFRDPGEKAAAGVGRPDRLLTIDEVAALLRVEARTVQRYMDSGRIQFARLGRAVRFRQKWVDAFLDAKAPAGSEDRSYS